VQHQASLQTQSDTDGTITKVDSSTETSCLGTDTNDSYTLCLDKRPLGSSSLTAKVQRMMKGSYWFAPIAINVVAIPKTSFQPYSITGPQQERPVHSRVTTSASLKRKPIPTEQFQSGVLQREDTLLEQTLNGLPYSFAWTICSAWSSLHSLPRQQMNKGTVTVSAPIAINVVAIPNVAPTVASRYPAANRPSFHSG